jgi:hypothetical protein
VPTLNIFYEQSAIATNLSSGLFSEPVSIPGGTVTLRAFAGNSRSNSEPLLTINTTLPENQESLVILRDTGSGLGFFVVPDAVMAVDANESSIRIIHAAHPAPVTVTAGATTLATLNAASASEPAIIPAGETTLTFTSENAALLDYPVALGDQQAYTLVFSQNGGQFSVISIVTPAPGRTSARVVHASPAYPAIDVYLDGALLAGDTGIYRASPRAETVSGQHQVAVYPARADVSATEPLMSETFSVPSGAVSFILLGTNKDLRLLAVTDNIAPTPPNTATIAFVNTLDTVPVLYSDTIPLDSSVDYGRPPVVTQLSAGAFDFSWIGINGDGDNISAELIEDAVLESGRSYLYLITGRTDNQAVIMSEAVGVDTQLSTGDTTNSDVLSAPARLHFINATDVAVDFLINESVVVSGLESRQGSLLVSTQQRAPIMAAQERGTGVALAEGGWELASDQPYTIILTGSNQDNLTMLFVPDAAVIIDRQSPRLRLINISDESRTRLGLGYSAPGSVEDTGTPFVGIPGSIRRLSIEATNSAASVPLLMSSGTFDLSVLDLNQEWLVTSVSSAGLEPGHHYDIIAYQYPDAARGYAFVVVYPASG